MAARIATGGSLNGWTSAARRERLTGATVHSILIPHRNRLGHLRVCVWSILRAATRMCIEDVEIIVVDNGSDSLPSGDVFEARGVRILQDTSEMPIFNKGACYNRGIDAAAGDVLTFLDADAVVGPEWLSGAAALADPRLTRLCYRVRYVDAETSRALAAASEEDQPRVDDLFSRYDRLRLAYEAYGDPDGNFPMHRQRRKAGNRYWSGRLADDGRHTLTDGRDNPHGNSQFSIRRDVLGDIRYDEAYVGRGFGDLDINRRIAAAHGRAYRGGIDYRPARCLLHLTHAYEPTWRTSQTHRANRTRYRSIRTRPKEQDD